MMVARSAISDPHFYEIHYFIPLILDILVKNIWIKKFSRVGLKRANFAMT